MITAPRKQQRNWKDWQRAGCCRANIFRRTTSLNIKFKFRTIIKLAVLFLFVGFVGMQFIPSTRNRSNQVLDADFAKTFGVPNDVQALLERSCYDCHSDNTKYPWYHRLQPAAWFMERHISEGKEELNFSDFGSYS